jgi:phospholipase/carboxylesterase
VSTYRTEGEFVSQQENSHANQPVLGVGPGLEESSAVMVMIHGRGASAQDILGITTELNAPGMSFIAPQAANQTWYPYSFLEPMEKNEPFLTDALNLLAATIMSIEEQGIAAEKVVLLGFSQGACLTSEFVARNARRYGGLCALSGGLIGPPGTSRDYPGSLDGTPVFLGCSDVDFHIPVERVHETENVLQKLGADVTKQIYPGMGHTINQDEINHVQSIVNKVLSGD